MLKVLTLENQTEWDEIVTSFKEYDVHYLSGYEKAFQIAEGNEPLLFYAENENIRAINVLVKRDIAEDKNFKGKIPTGKYFDFVTPYGYGGWIFEGEGNHQAVYDEYLAWCEKNGIVSEFTRFSLFSNSIGSYYGEVIPRTNNIVVSLDKPFDEMLMSFEYQVRKNYRRAKESGLKIIVEETGEYLDDFLRIYYGTMERDNAEESFYFSKEFFEQLTTMKNHAVYFHVVKDGLIISTELVLIGSKNMYSFLGGTDSEYYQYRPNDFLKVEVIKWGLEKGIKTFVLGGGYGADDGIYRYKKKFAPEGIYQFSTGQKIINTEKYNELVGLRNTLPESGYFPKYRIAE